MALYGPEAIKLFFMLNSYEHEISNAHRDKNIKKIQHFSGFDKHRLLVFLLLNVKMPTMVGISTFMSRKYIMLNRIEHEFYNLGHGL